LISNRRISGFDECFATTFTLCPMRGGIVPLPLRRRERRAPTSPRREDGPMATETIEVHGHIVDSLILAKILDAILEAGADYELTDVVIGKTNTDTSRASIAVHADDPVVLDALLDDLQVHGA